MSALYLSLLITSLAMAGILVLVFFDNRLKAILTTNLYQRAFTFFAVVAVTGILLTTTIGFTAHQGNNQQAQIVRAGNQH